MESWAGEKQLCPAPSTLNQHPTNQPSAQPTQLAATHLAVVSQQGQLNRHLPLRREQQLAQALGVLCRPYRSVAGVSRVEVGSWAWQAAAIALRGGCQRADQSSSWVQAVSDTAVNVQLKRRLTQVLQRLQDECVGCREGAERGQVSQKVGGGRAGSWTVPCRRRLSPSPTAPPSRRPFNDPHSLASECDILVRAACSWCAQELTAGSRAAAAGSSWRAMPDRPAAFCRESAIARAAR